MRIAVVGDNLTAHALAGYLRRARIAVVEDRFDFSIEITEVRQDAPFITFASSEPVLTQFLLAEFHRYKTPVLVIPPLQRRGVSLSLPRSDAQRELVERAVLQSVLEWFGRAAKPRAPRQTKPTRWTSFFRRSPSTTPKD